MITARQFGRTERAFDWADLTVVGLLVALIYAMLVVKAAELLGWVGTRGQRVEMTDQGRKFLAAVINTRKELLNARLREIFVFNMVIHMLKQPEQGEVPDEIILSQLALHFPHERPQRILRTVVAWARYAGLFKYNSTRKVLYGLKPAPAAT